MVERDPNVSKEGVEPVNLDLSRRSSRGTGSRERSARGSKESLNDRVIRRYAEELGMSVKDYQRKLPKPRRNSKLDTNGTSVVETRIPLQKMLEIAGISDLIDLEQIEYWGDRDFKKPDKPYIARLSFIRDTSVEDVRAGKINNMRGGTLLEGLAFYIYMGGPRLLIDQVLKFPGSQVDNDTVPMLSGTSNREGLKSGEPRHVFLSSASIDTKSQTSACLIASKI